MEKLTPDTMQLINELPDRIEAQHKRIEGMVARSGLGIHRPIALCFCSMAVAYLNARSMRTCIQASEQDC